MSSGTPIDLSLLPSPTVVEALDYETILAARIARFRQLATAAGILGSWDPTRESDPILIQLQEGAYRELLLRGRVNDAARALLLAHATKGDLDNLVAFYRVQRLPGEIDSRLRARAQLAMEGFSTAGPEGAYKYHALSADIRVKDVAITSPQPGDVLITILSSEKDGVASAELLRIVAAAVNAEKVRPLNDTVLLASAGIVCYAVDAEIEPFTGIDSALILQAARNAVEKYTTDCHVLGALVARSGLDRALHCPGVRQVRLLAPTVEAIDPGQTAAPRCTGITLRAVTANG